MLSVMPESATTTLPTAEALNGVVALNSLVSVPTLVVPASATEVLGPAAAAAPIHADAVASSLSFNAPFSESFWSNPMPG